LTGNAIAAHCLRTSPTISTPRNRRNSSNLPRGIDSAGADGTAGGISRLASNRSDWIPGFADERPPDLVGKRNRLRRYQAHRSTDCESAHYVATHSSGLTATSRTKSAHRRPGRFAPMSSASSIAANPRRKRSLRVPVLRVKHAHLCKSSDDRGSLMIISVTFADKRISPYVQSNTLHFADKSFIFNYQGGKGY